MTKPLLNLTTGASFDSLVSAFEWDIPKYFNIGLAICDKHVDQAQQIALYYEHENGSTATYTFADVRRLSNQMANLLRSGGVSRGDRVALILPQRIETAIAHIAAFKLGAISVPLSVLFGIDALQYRLQDSGASVVVTDTEHATLLSSLKDDLPALGALFVCNDDDPRFTDWTENTRALWPELANQDDAFAAIDTLAEDPALLIYTSGTTGPPKGALIAHRSLLGNLTGFEMSLDFFPQANDVFYTPADWAWTGGLFDGLIPTWYFAQPIVGFDYRKFDAIKILAVLEKYKVTCGFFPPTALKMLRAVPDLKSSHTLYLRSIMSAGEMVGEELLLWGKETLGVTINEMYGQTEHNYMVGNCAAIMDPRPGSMGKAYPGHVVEVMKDDGGLAESGEHGEFVAHRSDAVHYLGYWNNPEATQAKYTDNWFHTGDTGYRDADGYLWFVGRTDDVITSAGYRIGPGEIEDCILQHPAVLQVAAVGVPDPDELRGDIVKVFVVLNDGFIGSDELAEDIRQTVRDKLAAYEYPRSLEFIDSLPMTTTGKVRRIELRGTKNK